MRNEWHPLTRSVYEANDRLIFHLFACLFQSLICCASASPAAAVARQIVFSLVPPLTRCPASNGLRLGSLTQGERERARDGEEQQLLPLPPTLTSLALTRTPFPSRESRGKRAVCSSLADCCCCCCSCLSLSRSHSLTQSLASLASVAAQLSSLAADVHRLLLTRLTRMSPHPLHSLRPAIDVVPPTLASCRRSAAVLPDDRTSIPCLLLLAPPPLPLLSLSFAPRCLPLLLILFLILIRPLLILFVSLIPVASVTGIRASSSRC